MLTHLKVSNFAIIEQIEISFGQGLNILSGETGAGKSVLLKSLALLMGDKSDTDAVRTGFDQATIEGCFDLTRRPDIVQRLGAAGIPVDEDALIVRRIVARNGKGRVYLNGVLSPVSELRDLVVPLVEVAGRAPLIEMTGQHDNRHLLSRAFHLDLLDQYCGTWDLREQFAEKFRRFNAITQEIVELESQARDRTLKLDFLTYQRDELQAFCPQVGEDENLENETRRLKNATRLRDFIHQCEQALDTDDDAVLVRLQTLLQRAGELAKYDPSLPGRFEPLRTASSLIGEVTYDLRAYEESLQLDPQRQEELESRLNTFRQLQKKYGATAEEMIQALDAVQKEITTLGNSEEQTHALRAEQEKLRDEMIKLGRQLSQKRQTGGKLMQDAVNEELEDLNMKGLEFVVQVDRSADETFHATGFDFVEFLTRTSKKDEPKPLARFASGGELSRILLSIKQVVGESRFPRTYLFDEVDTGVSGPTAEKVGKKLRAISQNQQVICVTHLPQVAACGDIHFHIEKQTSQDSAYMLVTELKKTARVEEIARLISGEKITETSRKHARALLG